MCPTLDQASCASLPLSALPVLADLRHRSDIRVVVIEERAWIRWIPGDVDVLLRMLPVRGVILYTRRDGLWYRIGRHLPELALPARVDDEGMSLARALVPARIDVVSARGESIRPARLSLVRDGRVRPASGLRCTVAALARWAETISGLHLASLLGATDGVHALVLGGRLPCVDGAERFWGKSVLAPLGYRTEPDMPEGALRRALGIGEEEILFLGSGGYESVPRAAFRALDRSGIRLALGDRTS